MGEDGGDDGVEVGDRRGVDTDDVNGETVRVGFVDDEDGVEDGEIEGHGGERVRGGRCPSLRAVTATRRGERHRQGQVVTRLWYVYRASPPSCSCGGCSPSRGARNISPK